MGSLKFVWKKWKRFAEILGNFQMSVLLTIIYWTMLPIIAIPRKILSDPLRIGKSSKAQWISRNPITDVLEYMRRQG